MAGYFEISALECTSPLDEEFGAKHAPVENVRRTTKTMREKFKGFNKFFRNELDPNFIDLSPI